MMQGMVGEHLCEEELRGVYLELLFDDRLAKTSAYSKLMIVLASIPTSHQWLHQISMKLPFAVLRKSALKFTEGSKRENSTTISCCFDSIITRYQY